MSNLCPEFRRCAAQATASNTQATGDSYPVADDEVCRGCPVDFIERLLRGWLENPPPQGHGAGGDDPNRPTLVGWEFYSAVNCLSAHRMEVEGTPYPRRIETVALWLFHEEEEPELKLGSFLRYPPGTCVWCGYSGQMNGYDCPHCGGS